MRAIERIVIYVLLAGTVSLYAGARKKFKMVQLHGIDYSKVKKLCEPSLSSGGQLRHKAYDPYVCIYDTPDRIAVIEKIIKKADRPSVKIKITQYYRPNTKKKNQSGKASNSSQQSSSYSSSESRTSKKADFVLANENRVLVIHNAQKRMVNNRKNRQFKRKLDNPIKNKVNLLSQSTTVNNGWRAELWQGKARVNPSNLKRNELAGKNYDYSNVDIMLKAVPAYPEKDYIQVDIFPVLKYSINGRNKYVVLKALASLAKLKKGQRIALSDIIANNKEKYSDLFGPDFFNNPEIAEVFSRDLTVQRK